MESVSRQEEAHRPEDRGPEVAEGIARSGGHAIGAWTLGRRQVALQIDLALYSVDAVMRTAYKFTDRCYLFLSRAGGSLIAAIVPKRKDADLEDLLGQFSNELIDQRLRESLDQQFGQVRTLIVAQAFAEGNLLDPAQDDGDYHADPHGAGRRR
jgi:His-Xaa-Ser system protein HxsD